MAKLNVKVVDMVNGEITKVAYEGAEYAKVEGGEKGDIAVIVDAWGDQVIGEHYFVNYRNVDCDGNVFIGIDKGRYREYVGYERRMNYFRKISAPTLEERVSSLESDVAALKSSDGSLKGEKVAEEPKRLTVGDVAKIIGTESYHFGEIGDIVKIKIDTKDRQPYKCERISDGKDVGWFYESELKAYAEETIEFEGATYRKVEREAREGDVIVLSQAQANETTYVTAGKPYKVLRDESFVVDNGVQYGVYRRSFGRTRETVDVYEPVEQAQYVPQEGDIVVIVKSEHSSRNSVGDIGKVSRVSSVNFAVNVPQKPKVPGVNGNKHEAYEVRKATPAEVEKYEQAVKDAEIAEKWAKIGRKPNEFKKGDVVRVVERLSSDFAVGTLGVVMKDEIDDCCRPTTEAIAISGELNSFHPRVELVTPVESLFNTNA